MPSDPSRWIARHSPRPPLQTLEGNRRSRGRTPLPRCSALIQKTKCGFLRGHPARSMGANGRSAPQHSEFKRQRPCPWVHRKTSYIPHRGAGTCSFGIRGCGGTPQPRLQDTRGLDPHVMQKHELIVQTRPMNDPRGGLNREERPCPAPVQTAVLTGSSSAAVYRRRFTGQTDSGWRFHDDTLGMGSGCCSPVHRKLRPATASARRPADWTSCPQYDSSDGGIDPESLTNARRHDIQKKTQTLSEHRLSRMVFAVLTAGPSFVPCGRAASGCCPAIPTPQIAPLHANAMPLHGPCSGPKTATAALDTAAHTSERGDAGGGQGAPVTEPVRKGSRRTGTVINPPPHI